ncbi:MAG: superoxide dismutase [Bacilli bacterium]|nr:superoxide dismutase [Bacilli bacterium]
MYKLMKLPYQYNALKPDISEKTVNIHYNKHHKKYNDNLNKLIKIDIMPIEEIPKNIDRFPMGKRNQILFNAGGVLNHNLYWYSLGKEKIYPKGKLKEKIDEIYGNFENFKNSFIEKAKMMTGSGYTFLVTRSGNLTIINLPNQETPLSYDLIPLFNIDLWEHAYYLDYQNDRDAYIENFFGKANFTYASDIFEKIS